LRNEAGIKGLEVKNEVVVEDFGKTFFKNSWVVKTKLTRRKVNYFSLKNFFHSFKK